MKGAAETDGVGPGALQRREVHVLPDLDAGLTALNHRHHAVSGIVGIGEDGPEPMPVAQIAHPGQHPGDDVATLGAGGPQREALDAGEGLDRVGQTGAAQHRAVGNAGLQPVSQGRVVGVLEIPAASVLAPRAEGGGHAVRRHLRHGRDGSPQILLAGEGEVVTVQARRPHPAHQVGGVESLVDALHQGRQVGVQQCRKRRQWRDVGLSVCE